MLLYNVSRQVLSNSDPGDSVITDQICTDNVERQCPIQTDYYREHIPIGSPSWATVSHTQPDGRLLAAGYEEESSGKADRAGDGGPPTGTLAAVAPTAATTIAATYVPALHYYQFYQQRQVLQRTGVDSKESALRQDQDETAAFFHQTPSTAIMNGADINALRGVRDGYGGEDVNNAAVVSVNNILNGALGGANVQQANGNQLTAVVNGGYGLHPDHNGGGGASMGRSHSSSSTGSSGTGGQATPPALQGGTSAAAAAANHHQLQAAMAHQMALSHYNPAASFGPLAAFNNHLRTAAAAGGPQSVGGNLRRYPCKLCPAMFDSKAELQIHTQVHMREAKPYKCSHCVKSFANSSYLSQHMRIHLNIKPFGPCQYCGRKFTQLSHLQQHLRTHTGEKPYKCRHPGCEKAFSQLSNLQSHSRCHQTDKPYKCNSCYKCFTDEPSLLEHIPKHKESKHLKVHICPYCGKSYTQATYLAKHMTKHSDRKPVKSASMVAAAAVAAAVASGVTSNGSTGAASSSNDIDHLWVSRADSQSVCPVHGIVDSCHVDSAAAAGAISFNSFPAHNHIMQPQTCAYTPTGIANSMANMANVAAAAAAASNDPSAFTRLAGLAPLTARSLTTGSSRNPYFAYDNFKTAATHSSGLSHPSAPYNQLIRLDDIRNYAGQAAAAEHFSSMLQIKRDPREAAY